MTLPLLVLPLTLLVGCGVLPGTAAVGSAPDAAAAPAGGPTFGTLVSSEKHAREEAEAGVKAAMVELSWEQFEPKEDDFQAQYIQGMRDGVQAMRAAGRTVTLGLGLHESPKWLEDIPNSRLVDNSGKESQEINLVFNQEMRQAAEVYLDKVAEGIDLGTVDTVRLTSGGGSEVFFPDGGGYWAFDPNAQNGPGLPPSMAKNPAPGWHPGDPGLSADQVRRWADWYVGALVDTVNWQVAALRKRGFRGTFEVLTPGVGVSPKDYEQAIRSGLPAGQLGTGSAWATFYRLLPRRDDLVAQVSSVADDSGGNDLCQAGDRSVALDSPQAEEWSATRWVSRVAAEYGYRVSGENPGFRQDFSADDSYADTTESGMMATAIRQARSCGFRTFYWAHDRQLWDGTVPFQTYADRIKRGS